MSSRPGEVAAAYDAIAADYDRLVAEDAWMRAVLWRHYRRAIGPDSRVLEVGCGTGLDTFFLAEAGMRVVALDVSPGMVERLRAKLGDSPSGRRIEPRVQDAADLADWPGEAFDAIVAAFASVNTIVDLPRFAEDSARLLRPGGRMILHLLAPAGIWERRKAARERGRAAAQLLGQRRWRSLPIGGQPVRHRVLPPRAAERLFASGFRRRRLYGLGWLWPRDRSARIPFAAARVFGRLDAGLGSLPPFLGWGRFFVLDLERRR